MTEKTYVVRETQFGYTTEGPNGHKWQTTPEDGWQRTVAFAKALERAFLEGQKSFSSDMDIAVALELLRSLREDLDSATLADLRARVRLVASRADVLSKRLEAMRHSNGQDRIFQPEAI
jgi:hypothetical protein